MEFVVVLTFFCALSCGLGYPKGEAQDNVKADERQSRSHEDDSDMYMEGMEQQAVASHEDEGRQASQQQTFYPSFAPYQRQPLGHSRPFFYGQQEAAYSQRPQLGYQQQQIAYDAPRYAGYKDDGFAAQQNADSAGLLGSGNFGVIRGGTFYGGDGGGEAANFDNDYDSYFRNGHGRPFFYFGGTPNPRPYQHEQFANFRDFADINTPSNPAYSQYVVVYVNKNATKASQVPHNKPKNIIESLAMLDMEETAQNDAVPEKKLSKSKRKLAKLSPEKKHLKKFDKKATKSKVDLNEPLLALS